MIINEELVEKFLRTTISISVVAFLVMSTLAVLEIVIWFLLLPALISCAGVIVSFGIYINKLGRGKRIPITTPTPKPNLHS